jgi:hypothetical protein
MEENGDKGVGMVIGSEMVNNDNNELDEMESKKEKIMLM